jgi:hypothetical protein
MHVLLNAVDVSNTYTTLLLFSDFNLIFLTNKTYVTNGLRDFFITLNISNRNNYAYRAASLTLSHTRRIEFTTYFFKTHFNIVLAVSPKARNWSCVFKCSN